MIFLFLLFSRAQDLNPRAVVTSHLSEVNECYVVHTKEGLKKQGKLILSWTIDESGTAKNFRERLNELGDEILTNCIEEKIKTWHFQPSEKSKIQNFLFPFVFPIK